MADEPPSPPHRAGSFPPQDQPSAPRRARNDSPQRFADDVRRIPSQERVRVRFVAGPEELDPYDAINNSSYGPEISPSHSRGVRLGEDYQDLQHTAYSQPIPAYSAPYPRFRVPETAARPVRGPRVRSTVDSYASDRSQLSNPSRSGGGRVRFAQQGRLSRTSYSQRSLSPQPVDDPIADEWPSVLEDTNDAGYDTAPASYRSRSRSISRPRHHHVYRDVYRSDSESDDEEGFDELLGGKVFQFVPSRASRALAKSGHSIDTDASLDKSEDGAPNANDEPSTSKTSRILHVFQSQYTGDAVSDGTHTAKLMVVHDPKKQRQPLFRWMHLEQRMMNLDELSAEISRIPAITDSERNGFAKLLSEVKKNFAKYRPASKGNTVRHMDPKPVRVTIPPDGRTKAQTSRSLTWLCVPYFCLEKYSGLLSASTASSFPVETLLQSDYARTTQEREMQQAVCQNGEVPENHCFHIAQLWCIVLDNSLLITCGRMGASALRGDLVRIVTAPLKEPQGKGKTLYVSYYDTVLWALPLETCLTWFDFCIHFCEFWPQAVRIYHHGNVLSERDWPRIVNMIRNVNHKVILDLRLWFHPQPPAVGVLRPFKQVVEDLEKRTSEPSKLGTQNTKPSLANSDNVFHVFSWLDMTQVEAENTELDTETLITHLQEAEDYLLTSTTMRDRNAYNNCNSSSQYFVNVYLKEKGSEIEKMGEEKQEYENRVDLYNAADIIFSFFLPQILSKDIPTTGKFWGAIQGLVEMPNLDVVDDDNRPRRSGPIRRHAGTHVHSLRRILRNITREIQSFQALMSHAPTTIRTKVEIPDSLVCAWLHLVMALVQASANDESWNDNMNISEALIRRGMNDIMDELPSEDLLSSSVIQPMELVALLSSKLLQDSTGTYSNINETYSDYLKGLENEITANNSDRSHQFRLTLFKQEVVIIRRVVASQLKVIDGMNIPLRPGWSDQTRREREMLEKEREKSKMDARIRPSGKQGIAYVDRLDAYESHHPRYHRSVGDMAERYLVSVRDPDAFAKLTSTDPGGFRELLCRECRSWLERRDNEFLELEVEASRLEDMNANKIEVTKDRQEAAVYAFTMVTIIFLPLSTISSIFGMNSSDVRDMELGQWAYWAAAVPTTVAVIVTGLWWMGELHNIIDWIRGLPHRRNNKGYARVRRPAASGVIYYPQSDYPGMDAQTIRPYSRASRATLGPPPVPRGSWRY